MHVIGTAGHVDHGKSSLVTAFTGINPDRLKEEQARGMTMDLGFAWLTIPGGETVGIVDVPGHSDYIENMLAGVGGIDLALLVVAADEGVMAQTLEHLAILDLLGVKKGLIILTKCDLVEDTERLSGVEADIRRVVKGTFLADAPLQEVSVKTGTGLDACLERIADEVQKLPPRLDAERPRLSVDRAFSLPGYGTIVTGTLLDGIFRTGEEVVLQPAQIDGRIRSLQSYRRPVNQVEPGQRAAINLAGVHRDQAHRGDLVTLPGLYPSSRRADVWLRVLSGQQTGLRHREEVKCFLGAREEMGRVYLLAGELIPPGGEAPAQIEFSAAISAAAGDRFILRRPSPPMTIGGGEVLDPYPAFRHRRRDALTQVRLAALHSNQPEEKLLASMADPTPITYAQLLAGAPDWRDDLPRLLERLAREKRVIVLREDEPEERRMYMESGAYSRLTERAEKLLDEYHRQNPLKGGIPVDKFRQKLGLNRTAMDLLLGRWVRNGALALSGNAVYRSGFSVVLDRKQQQQREALLESFRLSPFSPPTVQESLSAVGKEVYAVLLASGDLRQLSAQIVFRETDFQSARQGILERVADGNGVTIAQVRDCLHTSRKYAQALLEYLDHQGETVRHGDAHFKADRIG